VPTADVQALHHIVRAEGLRGDVEQRVDLGHRAVDAPGLPHFAPAADEQVLRGEELTFDGRRRRGRCRRRTVAVVGITQSWRADSGRNGAGGGHGNLLFSVSTETFFPLGTREATFTEVESAETLVAPALVAIRGNVQNAYREIAHDPSAHPPATRA